MLKSSWGFSNAKTNEFARHMILSKVWKVIVSAIDKFVLVGCNNEIADRCFLVKNFLSRIFRGFKHSEALKPLEDMVNRFLAIAYGDPIDNYLDQFVQVMDSFDQLNIDEDNEAIHLIVNEFVKDFDIYDHADTLYKGFFLFYPYFMTEYDYVFNSYFVSQKK